jgi:hypothetical protein
MNKFKLENYKNINLGDCFDSAKDSLKNFKEKIEELEAFNKEGRFIYEYFAKLRNQIDIEREVVKLKIDQHYLNLIGEVDDIEFKCLSESTDTKRSIDEKVKKLDEKFEGYRIDLDQLKLDFNNWKNIKYGSNFQVKKLNKMIDEFKNELLKSQSYVFESNTALFDVANKASKIVAKKSLINMGNYNRKLLLI